MDKFSYINIREYLIQDNPNGIGEADLQEAVSDFSCPKNPDVEHFLKDNAIEFTKKNQSVTYLVMSNEDGMIVGYFTIALKPITVNANRMSNTVKRKLQRISKLDEATGTYTAAAFLIAQLGKNFTNQLNKRISGEELLDMAWTVVKELQYAAGGVVLEDIIARNSINNADGYAKLSVVYDSISGGYSKVLLGWDTHPTVTLDWPDAYNVSFDY